MNLIFETNYAIFAIFASLLITEIMGSVLLLFFYDATKSKVLEYIVPIWEVTGTFGAFWVVTGDFAFPSLLIPVASIFGALLTVFLILFVGRNASIVFGEFVIKRRWLDAKKLYQGYAVSTLLLGVSVLILLSSLVSGKGIVGLTSAFSLGNWISSPGSLVFLAGTLLIGVGLAPVFFGLKALRMKYFPLTVLGVIISIGAYYLYSPSFVSYWIAIPALLTVAAGLLFLSDKTASIVTNKAVFITLLSVIIFSLQPLIYPNVIGQSIAVDTVTTSGPMASVFYTITLGGGALLAVMLAFYVLIAMRQKQGATAQSEGAVPMTTPSRQGFSLSEQGAKTLNGSTDERQK
jgi:cytochrome bd ubiquinol oxidase subunit II